MTEYFVGREKELDAFKACLESEASNGIYYYGPGGIGKTLLLKKILAECKQKDVQAIFVDFFSTPHRSIAGLQNAIIDQLNAPQAFQEIFDIRRKLEELRAGASFSYRAEFAASLQKQIEIVFPRCCVTATQECNVVLVCDSFEYVQRYETGRWLLDVFLPSLKIEGKHRMTVAIAGRPEPAIAPMPENIRPYELPGLAKEDTQRYIRQIGLKWSAEFEALFEGTEGNPLYIELLRWRGRRDLLTNQARIREIFQSPQRMAEEIFDELAKATPRNRILWAMATLKRRFDFKMLRYLVENMRWLRESDAKYDVLKQELQQLPFVKQTDEVSTHLLHDVVVAPIALVFKGITGLSALRAELFEKIVSDYYTQQIQATQSPEERMYLQVEQFGYILDQDLNAGLGKYREYLSEIGQQNAYAFEDLLWNELTEHLECPLQTHVALLLERAKWLVENGLYPRLEKLSCWLYEMPGLSREDQFAASQYLGVALMQQGKLDEAEQQFQTSFTLAQQLGSETATIEIENFLGQLATLSGQYNQAGKHYWQCLSLLSKNTQWQKVCSMYSAYGLALAMQGHYKRAFVHCEYALERFEKYPDRYQQIQALINIGNVHQLVGNYDEARGYFVRARDFARQNNFIELEAEVLRELGYTAYLRGRRLREINRDLVSDCDVQAKAVSALMIALDKARTTANQMQISRILLRLAYVFEEIARLELLKNQNAQIQDTTFPALLIEELIDEARSITILEDTYHLQGGVIHFAGQPFSELTLLQKAVRLFEIGARQAREAKQSHIAIEAQMELSRILLELHAWDDVKFRLEHLRQTPSRGYAEETLAAFVEILESDLACDQGNLDLALTGYVHALPEIAGVHGTIMNIKDTRISELLKRIRVLSNQETAITWCKTLLETWLDAGVDETFPLLLERLQILRIELLERQAKGVTGHIEE